MGGKNYYLLILWVQLLIPLDIKADGNTNLSKGDSLSKVIISLDEKRQHIVVKLFIYPAHNDSLHKQVVKNISEYWNQKSGKYIYQIKSSGEKIAYEIKFAIEIPKGSFSPNGIYIPDDPIPSKYLNRVEVVDGRKMPPLKGVSQSQVRIAGYAPPNAIYLASDFASNTLVAAHEMGHQIGIEHSHFGVMATDVNLLSGSLSSFSVRKFFRKDEIIEFLRYKFYLKTNQVYSQKTLKRAKIKRQMAQVEYL